MAVHAIPQQWWVVNQISRPGGARGSIQTNYIIVESATRPANTVAGPFSTKTEAAAWQTGANTAGNSPGSAAGGAANAAISATGIPSIANLLTSNEIWIRAGEAIAGLLLLYIGAKAFFPTTVNTVTSTAKKAGKAAMFL